MLERSTNNTRQALVDWEAAPISAPLAQAAEAPGARPNWTSVQVPGHWQLQDPFARYQGIMLYRCRFVSRLAARERVVSLRFGAVYYSARVWLNGSYLGEHQGYFAAFEFDVTDILVQDVENELLVEVSSPEELAENDRETIGGVCSRWDGLASDINPGGIFRVVELVSSGGARIRSLERVMNLVTIPVLCPGYAPRRGDRDLANVDMLLKLA